MKDQEAAGEGCANKIVHHGAIEFIQALFLNTPGTWDKDDISIGSLVETASRTCGCHVDAYFPIRS